MSDKSYIEALEAEIQKLHANEDHLKTVINLYADLSNVGRSFVENALSLCKRWDVDADAVFDEDCLMFFDQIKPEDKELEVICDVGCYVVRKLNEDLKQCTGIENFFELSGNDGADFWFDCTDEKCELLKKLAQEDPRAFDNLEDRTKFALNEIYGLEDILKATIKKSCSR